MALSSVEPAISNSQSNISLIRVTFDQNINLEEFSNPNKFSIRYRSGSSDPVEVIPITNFDLSLDGLRVLEIRPNLNLKNYLEENLPGGNRYSNFNILQLYFDSSLSFMVASATISYNVDKTLLQEHFTNLETPTPSDPDTTPDPTPSDGGGDTPVVVTNDRLNIINYLHQETNEVSSIKKGSYGIREFYRLIIRTQNSNIDVSRSDILFSDLLNENLNDEFKLEVDGMDLVISLQDSASNPYDLTGKYLKLTINSLRDTNNRNIIVGNKEIYFDGFVEFKGSVEEAKKYLNQFKDINVTNHDIISYLERTNDLIETFESNNVMAIQQTNDSERKLEKLATYKAVLLLLEEYKPSQFNVRSESFLDRSYTYFDDRDKAISNLQNEIDSTARSLLVNLSIPTEGVNFR